MARPQLSPVALEALRAVDQEMAAGIDATSVLHRAAIRIEALEPVPAEVQIQVRQAILLERLDGSRYPTP